MCRSYVMFTLTHIATATTAVTRTLSTDNILQLQDEPSIHQIRMLQRYPAQDASTAPWRSSPSSHLFAPASAWTKPSGPRPRPGSGRRCRTNDTFPSDLGRGRRERADRAPAAPAARPSGRRIPPPLAACLHSPAAVLPPPRWFGDGGLAAPADRRGRLSRARKCPPGQPGRPVAAGRRVASSSLAAAP